MRTFPNLVVALCAATLTSSCGGMFEKTTETKPEARSQTLHALTVEGLDGKSRDMSAWRGKVVLVVNTASECGFTKQYDGLENLQERFHARGFDVLGFPCNDFGGQEPGSAAEIQQFCSTKFHVTFPLFAKVGVKDGPNQSPIYAWLGGATGKLPGWNFGKYLIDKDGKPIAFWSSSTEPEDAELVAAIEKALG
jgi:glutathione peroxidase